ncbi:hypothetical protein [Nonomuraea sp. NPDC050643]|uniref:hypothetical protein n=1 Tax=Nonomuraea sp. NPDC050643 TaxID=3155660 RepID=UPI0033DDEF45
MDTRPLLALAALTAALTVALTACGQATESAQPSPSAPAADARHRLETAKADCMKRQGFKYIPYVAPEKPPTEEQRRRNSGDYPAMKKYRQKYGFGVFAAHVYPKEMNQPGTEPADNPNKKVQGQLSGAQLGSYKKAGDVCMIAAAKQVLGLELKSYDDYYEQMNAAVQRAVNEQLDSDPKLVELAGAMATCLKGKGHTVGDTTPSAMSGRGQKAFLAQEDKLGRAQDPDVPDVAPSVKDGKIAMFYPPTLTPEEARPYLDKEIKAALDDLECGKDFYPAYEPRSFAIDRQVFDRFGM